MKPAKNVIVLAIVIAILATIATTAGLFIKDNGAPYPFTTLYGQTAQIFGNGIYQKDTLFIGAGFKGQDAVALFVSVPLLLVATILYRQGSLTGLFMLTGILGYFLYLYASMALGAAYNPLFLVYTIIFSACIFSFIQVFYAAYLAVTAQDIPENLLRRSLTSFMGIAGGVTLIVWCAPLISALINNRPPDRMDSYTTIVTYALDLAIIVPATFLSAYFVIRRNPLGYIIAIPLLTIIVLLAPQIMLSTIFQQAAGVPFTTAEMIGPVAGFVVLGLIAIWLLFKLLTGLANHETA